VSLILALRWVAPSGAAAQYSSPATAATAPPLTLLLPCASTHIFLHRRSIYVSYGGLLMLIQGAADSLQHMLLDSHVYCLVRKAAV